MQRIETTSIHGEVAEEDREDLNLLFFWMMSVRRWKRSTKQQMIINIRLIIRLSKLVHIVQKQQKKILFLVGLSKSSIKPLTLRISASESRK